MDSLNINGVEYVRADKKFDVGDSEWSVVRCDRAGAFVAQVVPEEESGLKLPQAKLDNARRLWYWSGAASLSELAMRGVSNPGSCKFPCAVPEMIVTDIIEIIPMTAEAVESVMSVEEWTGNDSR